MLLPRGWAHASAFRAELLAQLRTQPTAPSYYPGSRARRAAVAARYGAKHAAPVPPGAPRQGVGCDEEDEVLLVECGAVSALGATPSRQPRPPAPATALTPHS